MSNVSNVTNRTKYRVVSSSDHGLFEQIINNLSDLGYSLAFYQETESHYSGVMKLKEEQLQLTQAEDVINVDIISQENSEIKRHLDEGWVIIASYSKQVTMMKPKKAS